MDGDRSRGAEIGRALAFGPSVCWGDWGIWGAGGKRLRGRVYGYYFNLDH